MWARIPALTFAPSWSSPVFPCRERERERDRLRGAVPRSVDLSMSPVFRDALVRLDLAAAAVASPRPCRTNGHESPPGSCSDVAGITEPPREAGAPSCESREGEEEGRPTKGQGRTEGEGEGRCRPREEPRGVRPGPLPRRLPLPEHLLVFGARRGRRPQYHEGGFPKEIVRLFPEGEECTERRGGGRVPRA